LKRTEWTDSEDILLFEKFQELGPKWVQIAKYFPNRTDAMIKNRINLLKRHEQKRAEILADHDPLVLQMLQLSALAMNLGQMTDPVQQTVDTTVHTNIDEVNGVGEPPDFFEAELSPDGWFDPLLQGIFDEFVEFP
jgi:hypothetical protein